MGMDQQVHTVSGSQRAQYANFSGWDVYRSQLQLVTLLRPDVGGDIAQSLLNQADQNNGVWDRWTHGPGGTHVMTGDPAHAALPGIHAFGGTNFNAAAALTSMVNSATTVTAADLSRDGWNVMSIGERPSLDKWLSIHYIPTNSNAWGGAGETLEDAVADFGISQLAGRLGQSATQQQFLARAQYWKNVFNPGNGGYIQNRNENGTWPAFNAASSDGFAEGSAAQYTWMVPFNVRGLFDRMGGDATATGRLDTFFHNGDGSWALTGGGGLKAEMDNEPSIGVPWLYDSAGRPYKTQQTVRQVVNTLWSTGPGGHPGPGRPRGDVGLVRLGRAGPAPADPGTRRAAAGQPAVPADRDPPGQRGHADPQRARRRGRRAVHPEPHRQRGGLDPAVAARVVRDRRRHARVHPRHHRQHDVGQQPRRRAAVVRHHRHRARQPAGHRLGGLQLRSRGVRLTR